MQRYAAFFSGLLFGIGLVISQMINPAKIIAFLNIVGEWDPSLLLVMASALAVAMMGYRLVRRRAKPLFEASFHLPAATQIDRNLIAGAAIFGVGWGLAGFCPGPGIAAAALGDIEPIAFLLAMFSGMYAQRILRNRSIVAA